MYVTTPFLLLINSWFTIEVKIINISKCPTFPHNLYLWLKWSGISNTFKTFFRRLVLINLNFQYISVVIHSVQIRSFLPCFYLQFLQDNNFSDSILTSHPESFAQVSIFRQTDSLCFFHWWFYFRNALHILALSASITKIQEIVYLKLVCEANL